MNAENEEGARLAWLSRDQTEGVGVEDCRTGSMGGLVTMARREITRCRAVQNKQQQGVAREESQRQVGSTRQTRSGHSIEVPGARPTKLG